MADFDNTRSFQFKPDFDMCLARIYAWYEQRIIDRPLAYNLFLGQPAVFDDVTAGRKIY
jgi:hypothetical protein